MANTSRDRSNYIRLDKRKVDFYRMQAELDPKKLQDEACISEETWKNIVREESITLAHAVDVRKAIHAPDLFSIMHESKLAEFTDLLAIGPKGSALPDWEFHEPFSSELSASNGIKYRIWKLKHCMEKNRFARGKRYDLSGLPTKEFSELREFLVRHAEICNRLKAHSCFPLHYTTTSTSKAGVWWVLDEWIPGHTLEDVLDHDAFSVNNALRLMEEIAEGLKALHEADIIRRELSPRFIILREPDGAVVFTDFELGKLLDGSPTVRTKMPPDTYRAPEAGGALDGDDKNIDLYSWGRIFVHVVSGREPPPPGDEEQELAKIKLPKKVHDMVLRCVSLQAEKRPQTVDEVLKVLRTRK